MEKEKEKDIELLETSDDSADDKTETITKQHEKAQKQKCKAKSIKKYDHKYQAVWQSIPQFKNWIAPSENGILYFSCKYCNQSYKAGKSEVLRHLNSKKHSDSAAKYGQKQTVLTDIGYEVKLNVDKKCKRNEIKLASFIAEHNLSFAVSDHLVSLVQSLHLEKEVIQQMTCGRMKCRALIVNVAGRYSLENLVSRLKTNKFSLMIDELTDRSSVKTIAVVTRMYGETTVDDAFLFSKEVPQADTDHLYSEIVNFFIEHDIPYKTNMLGFAADGASVMMGKNHSVSTFLKRDIPFLFILKCICHSFALVASKACEKIPRDVENLIRLVYNYMHRSFKRLSEFKEFQLFLDLKPHRMLHPCQTRWLSLLLAVLRVKEQYPALKLYFDAEHLKSDNDDSSTSEIHRLLSNPLNKLYLDFLSYILPLFTDLNKEFQSEKSKIHVLHSKISQVYKTLLDSYLKRDYINTTSLECLQYRNPAHFVQLEDVYLGPAVAISLCKNGNDIDKDELHKFRLNCLNFYIEAANQIYLRFPFNSEYQKMLAQMNIVDPAYFKANRPPSVATLAVIFPPKMFNIEILESQWRLFRNDAYVDSQESNDYYQFWNGVAKIFNGDGSLKYGLLYEFVKAIAVLPHSSAAVERLFSQINLNKTKLRNSLENESVSGIMHTKRMMKNGNCYDYEIPNEMVQKHNNSMYS